MKAVLYTGLVIGLINGALYLGDLVGIFLTQHSFEVTSVILAGAVALPIIAIRNIVKAYTK